MTASRAWTAHSVITDNGQNDTDKITIDNSCFIANITLLQNISLE